MENKKVSINLNVDKESLSKLKSYSDNLKSLSKQLETDINSIDEQIEKIKKLDMKISID